MSRRARKSLLVLLVAVVVFGGFGSLAVVVRKRQISAAVAAGYAAGQAEFKAGRHGKAMPLIARYVGRNPRDPEALIMLAECRVRVPKPEGTEVMEAARYAEAALNADPGNVAALELLVDFYRRLGFVTELNRSCEALLAIRPDHRGAMAARVQALMSLGRYPDAAEAAQALIAANPNDADAHRLLLEIRRMQGASAAEIARAAGELADSQPTSFELAVVHAQTLLGTGDLRASVAAAERAAGLSPASLRPIADFLKLLDVYSTLYRSGERAGNFPDLNVPLALGRRTLDASLSDERIAPGVAAIGAGWEWRGGRIDEARRWVERGLAIRPDAPTLIGWRTFLDRSVGPAQAVASAPVELPSETAEEARLWRDFFAALDNIDKSAWLDAGAGLHKVQADALRLMAVAPWVDADANADIRRISAAQVSALAAYYEGIADDAAGEWQQAVSRWREAASTEPGWSLPLVNASQTLLSKGRLSGALETATLAFRARSGPLEAMTLARVLVTRLESGSGADSAQASLDTLLDALGTEPALSIQVSLLRLRAAIARGDRSTAQREIRTLVAADPPPASEELIAVAERARAAGIEQWADLSGRAQSGGPSAATALFGAQVALDAGRRDEAIELLQKASAGVPPAEAARFRLAEADILNNAGLTDRAREVLASVSAANAGSAVTQLSVLDNPAAWTDAGLVEQATARLRAATGDDGVEWKLVDATRLLTFSPEPARAQEVILRLNDVLRLDPQNAQAMALLAEWMLVTNNQNGAVGYLTRAVAIPDAPPSLYPRLISLQRELGRIEPARTMAREFAEIQGLSVDLRRTRARLLTELDLPDLALRDIEALSRTGSAVDVLAQARALLQSGDTAQAATVAQRVITGADVPRDQFLAGAAIMVQAGQTDRALALLDARPAGAEPTTPVDRALLLEFAGRHDQAEQALLAHAQAAAEADAYVQLARFQLRRGKQDQARQTIAAASARGLHSADLAGVDAMASAFAGPLTESQAQNVIDTIPPGPVRDLAEATRWFDQNPTQIEAFVDKLRPITRAAPSLLLASKLLVQSLLELGKTEEAVAAARSAAGAAPSSPEASSLLAQTLINVGRVEEARTAAETWRRLAADPLEPTITLAHLDIDLNRADSARRLLDPIVARAAQIAPDATPQVWSSLVSALARLGDGANARAMAALCSDSEPGWLAAMAMIAAGDLADIDAARAWLAQLRPSVLQLPQGRMVYSNAMAMLAARTGSTDDLAAAFAVIESDLTSDGAGVSELLMGAGLLEQIGRNAEAERLYRRIIQKDAQQWIALNNLSNLLAQRPVDAKEALALANRALGIIDTQRLPDATRALVVHTVARAQSLTGDQQQALVTVRRAIALDRSFGEARLTEAEILERAGESRRAQDVLQLMLRQAGENSLRLTDEQGQRAKAMLARLGG